MLVSLHIALSLVALTSVRVYRMKSRNLCPSGPMCYSHAMELAQRRRVLIAERQTTGRKNARSKGSMDDQLEVRRGWLTYHRERFPINSGLFISYINETETDIEDYKWDD